MLIGVGAALLASMGWAASSIILKYVSGRADTVFINTMRLWTGTVVLIIVTIVSGQFAALSNIPLHALAYVMTSGILALAIGDTIYVRSLSMLDASIAFPIAQCAFVLLSGVAAILWLDEPYTWITCVGAVLVMGGIYLIATAGRNRARTIDLKKVSLSGVALTLIAAVFWTASAIVLKIGSENLDALVVATVRISCAAVVLTLLTLSRGKQRIFSTRARGAGTLLLVAAAGILTYGIAGVAFVHAIQLIGAGKSVLLTTTAPLFALPLAIIFLKERPTRSTIIGVVICITGVYFVVM